MKHLLNEHTILELNCRRVSGRPSIVLENFNQYSPQEQAQINEAYNAMFDLMQQELLNEISLSGAKAKIKGKFAGAKAAMQGDQNAGGVGQQAELQSLFDDLKTNIGTIVAQHEKDVTKLGFKPEDEIGKALAQIRQTIEASPANIEIKDNSLAGKAGHFAKEKVIPVVMKAVSPVISKVTQMYEKSGPIKGFDDKYQKIVSDIGQKFPALAEPLSKMSEIAKQHKGKATFLIGSLTALLTITGGLTAGGLGVFALGVGLRGVFGMLAGEPPAKAFGKAALTAAVGKLVGGAFNMLFGDIDFNLLGADETGAKAGVGELTGGEEVADAGGGTNPLADGGYSDPSAESALQDLDAKGLSMMHGDAPGNIKDLIAWSDEYTPTGAGYEGRALLGLKETDPDKFRELLFYTMSQAKEEEMAGAMKSLTAAAKEAGVDTADAQAMMELDPVTYQQYQLASVQEMELSAAADGGNMSDRSFKIARMFRDKYNAQFPDELPTDGTPDYLKDMADGGAGDANAAVEYKLDVAENFAKEGADIARSPVTPGMLAKMADHVKVTGGVGSAGGTLDGEIIRGNIFLNPDEAAEFNANFQGTDRMSPKAGDWLRDNVESADQQLDADAAADAAERVKDQEWFDKQTPEKQAEITAARGDMDDTY